MIALLLLAAVGAGAFWAGKNNPSVPSAKYSPHATASAAADGPPERREVVTGRGPLLPWVAGAVVLGVLLLGMATGPAGLLGGLDLLGGPGQVAELLGP